MIDFHRRLRLTAQKIKQYFQTSVDVNIRLTDVTGGVAKQSLPLMYFLVVACWKKHLKSCRADRMYYVVYLVQILHVG